FTKSFNQLALCIHHVVQPVDKKFMTSLHIYLLHLTSVAVYAADLSRSRIIDSASSQSCMSLPFRRPRSSYNRYASSRILASCASACESGDFSFDSEAAGVGDCAT